MDRLAGLLTPTSRRPVLLSSGMFLLDTKGGTNVTVVGDYFGPFDEYITLKFGMYRTTRCSVYNHTVAKCICGVGIGQGMSTRLVVSNQESNVAYRTLSYKKPIIYK